MSERMQANNEEEDTNTDSPLREDDREECWFCHACTPKSNVVLLGIVFALFGTFALSEIVAAFAANSLSLLGDAASMVVDSLTYVLNMFAERKKARGISEKTRIKLEFYIPIISMLFLTVPTIYVMVEAVGTIRTPPEDPTTQDTVMMIFASTNLAIDALSVFFFARVNALLGYNNYDENGLEEGLLQNSNHDHHRHQSNTNMCSAYTHVIADTLRSIAVLTAALISKADRTVNPDVSDAWAAIAVSCIIFVTLFPLLSGLGQKYAQLRSIS